MTLKWTDEMTADAISMIQDGKGYQEIADELGTTYASVRQKFYKLRNQSDQSTAVCDNESNKTSMIRQFSTLRKLFREKGLESRLPKYLYNGKFEHQPGYSFRHRVCGKANREIMIIDANWTAEFFGLLHANKPPCFYCAFYSLSRCCKPDGYENCTSVNRDDKTCIIFVEVPEWADRIAEMYAELERKRIEAQAKEEESEHQNNTL